MPFDVTYHFVDGPGNTASGAQVSQNFTDVATIIESHLASYKRLHRLVGLFTATPGTLLSAANIVAANVQVNSAQAVPLVYALTIDPAAFAVSGRSTMFRLSAAVITNAVAPAVTLTFTMQPITTYGGASGSEPFISAVGAALAGSTFTIVSPAASARTTAVSSDFAVSSAGAYVVAVNAAAPAAGASVDITATLDVRQV